MSRDAVVVTTRVQADPATAFAVFTEDVDAWWKQGPRYRVHAERESTMRFEPHVDGRFLEVYDPASGDAFEHGRVRVWEPPTRLVFEMRGRDVPPDQATRVEVIFEAEDGATRVTVRHAGWAQFPEDHPVRHGLTGLAFENMMSLWWADLLVEVRARVLRDGGRPVSGRDRVRVSVRVGVDPDTAFEVFTAEIGAWWCAGRDLGTGARPPRGVMRFEPGAGGRLLETYRDADPFEVGRVHVWEPGRRLVFEWRQGNFDPELSTEVEVLFEPEPSASDHTRVTVEHRGFAAIPKDHSARHGLGEGAAFEALWLRVWRRLLASAAAHAEGRPARAQR